MNLDMLKHQINLAVYGQLKGAGGADDTSFAYTYPNPNAHTQEAWVNSFFDPRDARNFTPEGEDAFAIWSNNEGNYYAIIFPSNDGRNGRLMLAINVKGYMSQDGFIVLQALKSLKDYFVEKNNDMLKDIVEVYLNRFDDSLMTDYSQLSGKKASSKGYRIFTSENDLSVMFTYIHQSDYSKYKCVYLVPNDQTQPDANFQQITIPISITYQIVDKAPDVSAVQPSRIIKKGDILKIKYSKPGCVDAERDVRVLGVNCNELFFDGSTIHVKGAASAGVSFKRRINLQFVDDATNEVINNVSIKEYTSNSYNVKNWIEVDENCQQTNISVKATGYHDENSINIGAGEILAGSKTIRLKVKSESSSITIYLPDGTPAQIKVNLKHTNPLYKYIKNNGSILYMEQDRRRYGSTSNSQPIPLWKRILRNPWTWIISALTALVLLGYWFWPFGEDDEPKPAEEEEYVQKADSISSENDLQADLEYLKTNDDCWDKAQLKTDEYRNLIDFIAQGQVREAFDHTYKDKVQVNILWKGRNGCVDVYNEIRGKVSESEIREALLRSRVNTSNDQISVKKLNNELIEMRRKLNSQNEPTNPTATSQQTTNSQHQSTANRTSTSDKNQNVNKSAGSVSTSNETNQRHTSD